MDCSNGNAKNIMKNTNFSIAVFCTIIFCSTNAKCQLQGSTTVRTQNKMLNAAELKKGKDKNKYYPTLAIYSF
jgi:hypothetical protein